MIQATGIRTMIKKIVPVLLLVATTFTILAYCKPEKAVAPGEGMVFFKGSWKEAVAKAAAEKKPIFLDIYATWCGPCKMLKKETFVDKEVAKFYNAQFINVTLDGEKGDGLMLAEKYRIEGYPTLMIFSPQGKPVLSTAGFLPASDFLAFGRDGLKKVK